MESKLYEQALSFFNKGEYEEVLKIFRHTTVVLSEKEKILLRESRKQVTEQYLFLIKDYIQQKEYIKAKELQKEYNTKYDFDERVSSIVVTTEENSPTEGKIAEEQESIFAEDTIPPIDKNEVPPQKTFVKGVFITILFLSIIGVWMWYNAKEDTISLESQKISTSDMDTKTQPESYMNRCKEIIKEITNRYGEKIRIIGKYPKFSKYVIAILEEAENSSLIIYDLDKQTSKRLNLHELKMEDGSAIGIYGGICVFENNAENKLLVIGDNNINGEYSEEYFIEINPVNCEMRNIDWGNQVEYQSGRITVTKNILLREREYTVDNDCVPMYTHYNLDGTPIILTSSHMLCKGNMIGYPIAMDIFIDQNGKISGKYENVNYGIVFTLAGEQEKDGTLYIIANKGNARFQFVLSASSSNTLTGYGYGIDKNKKLKVYLEICK